MTVIIEDKTEVEETTPVEQAAVIVDTALELAEVIADAGATADEIIEEIADVKYEVRDDMARVFMRLDDMEARLIQAIENVAALQIVEIIETEVEKEKIDDVSETLDNLAAVEPEAPPVETIEAPETKNEKKSRKWL